MELIPFGFDFVWDNVLDPMHCLFLGVSKRIFNNVWFCEVFLSYIL
jgi:hypothetical protein